MRVRKPKLGGRVSGRRRKVNAKGKTVHEGDSEGQGKS